MADRRPFPLRQLRTDRDVIAILFSFLCGLVSLARPSVAQTNLVPGVEVPESFEVTHFATDDLAHDIYAMTVDAQGNVVVAGAGYIARLRDDDEDGRADRADLLSEFPSRGAQGLLFLGGKLYCTGDNGVWLLEDRDGDGLLDRPEKPLMELKNPEHGSHGLVHGPDGWIYLVCGNDAGVRSALIASDRSPVLHPQSGVILRFTPDGQRREIVADGFRNPYDLDFGAFGALLTVDSDGERDHHLPWYVPTRLFRVESGAHHGWVNNGWTLSWSRPASFFDNIPPSATYGRGSPTGVAVYGHDHFPARYRDGAFTCCWTLGRVYFTPSRAWRGHANGVRLRDGVGDRTAADPEKEGSVSSEPEIFLQTTGTQGFAPVDIAVGRQGELYVAIGGRGTQGGVFCIRAKHPAAISTPRVPLDRVLRAPQPLASWSRADWEPLARSLGAAAFVPPVLDGDRPTRERSRAIEVLTELFGGVPEIAHPTLMTTASAPVRQRLAWSLGRQSSPSVRTLELLLGDSHPGVVAEALRSCVAVESDDLASYRIIQAVRPHLMRDDRAVRQALSWVLERRGILPDAVPSLTDPLLQARLALSSGLPVSVVDVIAQVEQSGSPWRRLEAIRILQQSLGPIQVQHSSAAGLVGYSIAQTREPTSPWTPSLVDRLAACFPIRNDDAANRELARLLGLLRADAIDLPNRVVAECTAETPVEHDLHYLMVLAHLPGSGQATEPKGTETKGTELTGTDRKLPTEATALSTATRLLQLPTKLRRDEQRVSRNWPMRVGEMVERLLQRDPRLADTIASAPELAEDDHGLLVLRLPAPLQPAAARRVLGGFQTRAEAEWNETLLDLVGLLATDEQIPFLKDCVARSTLGDVALGRLAVHLNATSDADRALLREGLASGRAETVEAAAKALAESAEPPASADDWVAAMRALSRHAATDAPASTWNAVDMLLTAWAGNREPLMRRSSGNIPSRTAASARPASASSSASAATVNSEQQRRQRMDAWMAWIAVNQSIASEQLATANAVPKNWETRLAEVDWLAGDARRGAEQFRRRQCAACHLGNRRLGPELDSVARRFSRSDLFTAIVDPQRDVSPTYLTTRFTTADGRVFRGVVVYESPNGTLIQTGANDVVRIADTEIVERAEVRQSLMPAGLLDDATNRDLADLDAYLRALGSE